MPKSLLLISKDSSDLVFASEVAAGAGISVRQASQITEAVRVIADEKIDTIFFAVDSAKQYQEFEKSIHDTIGLFSENISANSIHFISTWELSEVPYLFKSPIFGHFISRRYHDPKEAGKTYARIVKATLSDRAFGTAGLLRPQAKIQVIKLANSSQKQDAVEAVRTYLLSAKFQQRAAAVVANAVDELLMNAIYDAAVDDLGRPIHATTARTTSIQLEGRQTVELTIGYDGEHVAITAADLFGSLDKTKLLTHVSKVYSTEEYKVRTSVAGAGIGLATVFQSGGSLFFVSEAQTRTEVTVFFKKLDSYKEFRSQFRFLSTQFYY